MHIGNFLYVKNHVFLVELAEQLKDKQFRMVLIGDGPLREEIASSVKEKGLEEVLKRREVRRLCVVYDHQSRSRGTRVDGVARGAA